MSKNNSSSKKTSVSGHKNGEKIWSCIIWKYNELGYQWEWEYFYAKISGSNETHDKYLLLSKYPGL